MKRVFPESTELYVLGRRPSLRGKKEDWPVHAKESIRKRGGVFTTWRKE